MKYFPENLQPQRESVFSLPVQSGSGPLSHSAPSCVHQKFPYASDLISRAAGPGEDPAGSLSSLKAPSLLPGKLFSSFTRAICLFADLRGERQG